MLASGWEQTILSSSKSDTSHFRSYRPASIRACLNTSAESLSARISRSPVRSQFPSGAAVTSYRLYFILGEKEMARFPGSVQGVVVQMTMDALLRAPRKPFGSSEWGIILVADAHFTGNFTHTWSETWSSYSTSASASAVFSTTDHITGFEPR